jgi:hypothetical protein
MGGLKNDDLSDCFQPAACGQQKIMAPPVSLGNRFDTLGGDYGEHVNSYLTTLTGTKTEPEALRSSLYQMAADSSMAQNW